MTAELLSPRGAPRRTSRRAPWTLMFHSVDDCRDDPYLVTVSPARLAQQLAWLPARAGGEAPRLFGLTCDDGYEDFRGRALPLLLEHGHTATVFVLPGRLGG